MYSDCCQEFQCQEPLLLTNRHTGEVAELLCWDWPAESEEQVATVKDGVRIAASVLALHWRVNPCVCGEQNPAANWPAQYGAMALRYIAETRC
jgi:hypothetical protein